MPDHWTWQKLFECVRHARARADLKFALHRVDENNHKHTPCMLHHVPRAHTHTHQTSNLQRQHGKKLFFFLYCNLPIRFARWHLPDWWIHTWIMVVPTDHFFLCDFFLFFCTRTRTVEHTRTHALAHNYVSHEIPRLIIFLGCKATSVTKSCQLRSTVSYPQGFPAQVWVPQSDWLLNEVWCGAGGRGVHRMYPHTVKSCWVELFDCLFLFVCR